MEQAFGTYPKSVTFVSPMSKKVYISIQVNLHTETAKSYKQTSSIQLIMDCALADLGVDIAGDLTEKLSCQELQFWPTLEDYSGCGLRIVARAKTNKDCTSLEEWRARWMKQGIRVIRWE